MPSAEESIRSIILQLRLYDLTFFTLWKIKGLAKC